MPLSESLTREGILHNYEPADSLHDPSHNATFELYVIDTEDDRENITNVHLKRLPNSPPSLSQSLILLSPYSFIHSPKCHLSQYEHTKILRSLNLIMLPHLLTQQHNSYQISISYSLWLLKYLLTLPLDTYDTHFSTTTSHSAPPPPSYTAAPTKTSSISLNANH